MTATSVLPPTSEAMRDTMVASQLRTTAVADVRVVAAMARVPRERFMPAGSGTLAYRDTPVPLGQGRSVNSPMATGRLLDAARLRPDDRVLLIGAASGYTAAVLVELVRRVTGVECDAGLAAQAQAAVPGATIVAGPLEMGHADGAPYDVLVIDGAVDEVPSALVAQLAIGGRVVSGIVDRGVTRLAAGRRSEGGFGMMAFADVECVVLPGFAKPRRFSF